jgi:hypothetical protein
VPGEPALERRNVDVAVLEVDEDLAGGAPERVADGVLGELLAPAERGERVEHARRQDAAPVDQEPVHASKRGVSLPGSMIVCW